MWCFHTLKRNNFQMDHVSDQMKTTNAISSFNLYIIEWTVIIHTPNMTWL